MIFFFFSPNLFSMNNKENGSRVSCIFLKQSGVRALTQRPQNLLISLTNWVKVARDSLLSTSSATEIRACLFERTHTGWEAGNERKEERPRNQRPALFCPPLVSCCQYSHRGSWCDEWIWPFVFYLTDTQQNTYTLKTRGSDHTNGSPLTHSSK